MFKTATYSNIETNAKTYGNNNIAPVTLATKNLQESLDDAPGGVARKLLAVGSGRPPPSRRREAWLPGRVLWSVTVLSSANQPRILRRDLRTTSHVS